MCDPFLGDPYKSSVGVLTSIYNQDSTYLRGRYVDMLGTTCSDENIIYGMALSEDGKTIALNLYNYNTEASDGATIDIDFARLGLGGAEIESAANMFTGSGVTFGKNQITLPRIGELGIASVIIKLK